MSAFVDVDSSADPTSLVRYLDQAAIGLTDLKQVAISALDVLAGQRILDVGCGAGHTLVSLARLGARPVGIDASAVMTGQSRERCGADIQIVCGEATSLPFRTTVFDACHTERVLQHLSDLSAVVAELARVTVSGGRLVSLETQWNSFRLTVGHPALAELISRGVSSGFRQPDLRTDLPAALNLAGFTHVRLHTDTMRSSLADLTAASVPKALARIASSGLADADELEARWIEMQSHDAPDAVLLDRIVFSAVRA